MKKVLVCLILSSLHLAYAQMSESEVSDMCMNQIVAGMAQDKVLGGDSGICVKFTKDSDGNINGMDFKMNTSAFELGKDQLQDDEQKRRIQTIKDFVVNYQQLVTKNKKLTIEDVDIQIRSYADGVAGPTSYDNEIKKMGKWSDLLNYIGGDKEGVKHLMQTAPQSKKVNSPVNFSSLTPAAQSTIRNIVLAKRRSQTICKEFGIKDCEKRENSGFSSPDLEKRNKDQRNCDDRRVSVISVNLDKSASIHTAESGAFHPSFGIPSGPQGEELKVDMQMASAFEIIRQHNATMEKFKDSDAKAEFKKKYQDLKNNSKDVKEKVLAGQVLSAIAGYDGKTYGMLDLPEAALKSPEYLSYRGMLSAFAVKHENFIKQIKSNFPELLDAAKSGDFYTFKEKSEQIKDVSKKKKLEQLEGALVNYGSNTATDFYNFFSTSEALKYHYAKNPNNSNLVSAATVLNQSNADLKIKLDGNDLKSAKNKKKDDGRAHWMCYGGCETGIHETESGDFETSFRSNSIPKKNAEQMHKEFGNVPLGFGSLKSLNVYVINDCSNCDCLKQRDVRMEDILNGPQTKKVAINKVTKQANGERGFSQSVGKVQDPANTCIFTPPVAHTCKVDPSGSSEGNSGHEPKTNYSCAMWDKSAHGLKWTANFVKEGLGLAETATDFHCAAKAQTLKDAAKGAICDFTDPRPVPDTCQ